MKRTKFTKTALVCLFLGMLVTAGVLILSRFVAISDPLRGFLTGIGLALEMIGIIKIDRGRMDRTCKV